MGPIDGSSASTLCWRPAQVAQPSIRATSIAASGAPGDVPALDQVSTRKPLAPAPVSLLAQSTSAELRSESIASPLTARPFRSTHPASRMTSTPSRSPAVAARFTAPTSGATSRPRLTAADAACAAKITASPRFRLPKRRKTSAPTSSSAEPTSFVVPPNVKAAGAASLPLLQPATATRALNETTADTSSPTVAVDELEEARDPLLADQLQRSKTAAAYYLELEASTTFTAKSPLYNQRIVLYSCGQRQAFGSVVTAIAQELEGSYHGACLCMDTEDFLVLLEAVLRGDRIQALPQGRSWDIEVTDSQARLGVIDMLEATSKSYRTAPSKPTERFAGRHVGAVLGDDHLWVSGSSLDRLTPLGSLSSRASTAVNS
jgi:hypothetical protein